MSGLNSTEDQPVINFTSDLAGYHWRYGNGEDVYVDMYPLMATGPGASVRIDDFSGIIQSAMDGQAIGYSAHYETNSGIREATGASQMSLSYSLYREEGILSEGSYIYGNTMYGFRGDISVVGDGVYSINGEIRAFNDQFDFGNNGAHWVLETARAIGHLLAGNGTSFTIKPIGEGWPVVGTYYFENGVLVPTQHQNVLDTAITAADSWTRPDPGGSGGGGPADGGSGRSAGGMIRSRACRAKSNSPAHPNAFACANAASGGPVNVRFRSGATCSKQESYWAPARRRATHTASEGSNKIGVLQGC